MTPNGSMYDTKSAIHTSKDDSYIGFMGFVFQVYASVPILPRKAMHWVLRIPFSAEATCDFDYAAFPWDRQACPVVFYTGKSMAEARFPDAHQRHLDAVRLRVSLSGLKERGALVGCDNDKGLQERLMTTIVTFQLALWS